MGEYYSAKKVIELGLIPWIKSIPTLTKLIRSNLAKKNESFPLKVIIKGEGHKRRYFIEKDSLVGIVKQIEKGKKGIVRVR